MNELYFSFGASGSVKCGNVNGSVDASGSVKCEKFLVNRIFI